MAKVASMVKVALYVRLEAKPGKEAEVEELLRSVLPIVQAEPDTLAWFGIRMGPSTFGIFDAFPDESGRQAHLAGRVTAALMAKAPNLLAQPPQIWQQARTELATLGARLARAYPLLRRGWSLRAAVLRDEAMKKAGLGLFALFGPAVVLLLIACSNVANLLLARATQREREVAVRAALGATRLRLVRERFAESAWIALAAGLLGLCLAAWGVQVGRTWIVSREPELSIVLDGHACLLALALTLVTPLLFGLVPAIQGSRPDLNKAMRPAGRRSQGRGEYSGRDLLVIAEMAVAVVLVVASTLFVTLFWELSHFDRGFDSLHVLAANLTRSVSRSGADGDFGAVLDTVRALPGVRSAALSDASVPFGSRPEAIELADCATVMPRVPVQVVSGDYFATLGVRVLSGRPILDSDVASAPPVALISETLAARCWPGSNPLGHRLRVPNYAANRWVTVAGVFRDVIKGRAALMAPSPVYLAAAQTGSTLDTLFIHASGDPVALIPSVRLALRSVDPQLRLDRIDRIEDRIASQTSSGWVLVDLIGAFAVLALVLAALGVYMVMTYAVAERTPEFGIRMALGASRGDVLRLVLGRGGTITGIGVLLGGGGTIVVTRLVWAEILGVGSNPLEWVLVALLLAAVSLGACVMPAYHATRVDPMVTLRCE